MAPAYKVSRGMAKLYLGADLKRYIAGVFDDVTEIEARITQRAFRRADERFERLRAPLAEAEAALKAERKRMADDNLRALTKSVNDRMSNAKMVRFFPAGRNSGIYFLKRDKVVVYVGQSVGLGARISSHMMEGQKKFDEVVIFYCDAKELNHWEGFFIRLLRPEYNGGVGSNRNNLSAPFSALWDRVQAWQIGNSEAPTSSEMEET
jgi:hypothetical protein